MEEKRCFFVEERSGGRVFAEFVGYMKPDEIYDDKGFDLYDAHRDPLNPYSWILSEDEVLEGYDVDSDVLQYIVENGYGYIKE